jgi:tetratricopeptide (TPR) repeat protein
MSDTKVTFNNRVARAMRSTYEAEKDGALISETAGAKRLVFFERGYLVGAKSEVVRERLGEVIVAEGGVTRAQLEEATGFIRSGRKLGRILVELGYLKPGQIETYVRRQIIKIASAMLTSKSERLAFSTVLPIEALTLSPVSIGDVFLDAAFHLTDIALYREKWLLDEYVLAQTTDALALAGHMKLSADDGQVLDLVDERNTVAEVVAASALEPDRTLRLLLALHQAGIVTLRPAQDRSQTAPVETQETETAPAVQAPSEPDPLERELIAVFNDMQCQNHWQVLGLQRNAGVQAIGEAYQAACERFDAARYQHLPDSDLQEKLSSVRARLREAFLTLSSKTSTNVYDRMVDREGQYAEKRESWETIPSGGAETAQADSDAYDRPKNPEEAKALFKKAKRAYHEQDYWRTIELCRSSIELSKENDPEIFHLLGMALSENPRWRQDAEQNLKIAHNLKPWQPKYLVSLAKFYDKVGLQHRSQRLYEQVRVMDPDYQIGADLETKRETDAEDVLDEKVV